MEKNRFQTNAQPSLVQLMPTLFPDRTHYSTSRWTKKKNAKNDRENVFFISLTWQFADSQISTTGQKFWQGLSGVPQLWKAKLDFSC